MNESKQKNSIWLIMTNLVAIGTMALTAWQFRMSELHLVEERADRTEQRKLERRPLLIVSKKNFSAKFDGDVHDKLEIINIGNGPAFGVSVQWNAVGITADVASTKTHLPPGDTESWVLEPLEKFLEAAKASPGEEIRSQKGYFTIYYRSVNDEWISTRYLIYTHYSGTEKIAPVESYTPNTNVFRTLDEARHLPIADFAGF